MMKKLMMLPLCLVLCGCDPTAAQEKALSADGLALVGCVVSAAESGNIVENIAVSCGPMLIKDVVSILDAAKVSPAASPALTLARSTTNPLKN
jgi:hypothetical protein